MGLLDSILGSVLGGGSGNSGQNSGQAALINAVIQMLANRQGGNIGGASGGLAGLVEAFSRNGMGDVARSWVGTGQNMPISAEQIRDVFGGNASSGASAGLGGILAQLAQQTGMSQEDASSQLSQVLPGLVDKLTPDGEIPQQDSLEKMLGAFDIGR